MLSIKKILNTISNFRCEIDGKEIIFPGTLQEKEENIILITMFPIEGYRKIGLYDEFVVTGKISGTEITLMGCHIQSASYTIENNDISLFIVPNEIIVGKCFYSMPMAKRIIVSTSDLNYMFAGLSPLESNYNFTKENPSVLNYTFPKLINAKDKYGEIELYQTFDAKCSIDVYEYSIISVIEYSFTKSMPLMDAVAKIAAARSLFSFFGNGYVAFGSITFEDDMEETKYILHLNCKEKVPAVNEPFLITTSMFGNQFQKVWESWLNLYESASPIPTLFYEIVCNRSTRINYYLNLSQAIEV